MSKELRPYQSEAHEVSIKEYNAGIIRQLLVLMTGAGKTFLTIKLLERYGFKRVLWLSFQEELVSQSALAFIREKFDDEFYNQIKEIGFLNFMREGGLFNVPDFKIGCIKADIWRPDGHVVMGSVPTIHRRLDRLTPDYYDCVICDEAHLFGSTTAHKVLTFLQPKLLLGLTATPIRADGVMLCDIFEKIVFEYSLDKGIKDGYACEMDAVRVKTNVSLDKVKTTAGELNLGDLSNEVNTLARNQLIVDSYKKYADGRQCMAFCVDIQHAIDLAETFKNNGLDCEAVSSNEELTPDRNEKIDRFKNKSLQIITNVNILTTGFDHPDTGAIIMACPTKSLTKYLQAVGRGARLKGKEYVDRFGQNCMIIDIVDSTTRHSLVNAWELDKQKPVEERTFVTRENKDILIADRLRRSAKLEHIRQEDEKVNLLKLPALKISKSWRMEGEATEAQLKAIEKWGYDIVNTSYTKSMISEIFGQQECTAKQKSFLKWKGYDTSGFVSVAVATAAFKEIREKEEKAEREKRNETIKSKNPFKF